MEQKEIGFKILGNAIEELSSKTKRIFKTADIGVGGTAAQGAASTIAGSVLSSHIITLLVQSQVGLLGGTGLISKAGFAIV